MDSFGGARQAVGAGYVVRPSRVRQNPPAKREVIRSVFLVLSADSEADAVPADLRFSVSYPTIAEERPEQTGGVGTNRPVI